MKVKPTAHKRMTYQDAVTAAQAIEACATLSTFLLPVLRDTQKAGSYDGAVFLSGMIADLGALRESLCAMLAEDKIAH